MLAIRLDIAAEEEPPMRRIDLVARETQEGCARRGKLTPLLADLSSLGVIERRQEVAEIAVSGVGPMKLHAIAQQQSGCRALRCLLSAHEQYVQRRQALACKHLQRAVEEPPPRRGVRGDQPRTGRRSERNRGEELRIVALPVTVIGIGP